MTIKDPGGPRHLLSVIGPFPFLSRVVLTGQLKVDLIQPFL